MYRSTADRPNTGRSHSTSSLMGPTARRMAKGAMTLATGERARSHFGFWILDFGLGFKSAIRNPQSTMGMTLMEILVVLGVIGIIVGMSVPALTRYAGSMRLKAVTRQVTGLVSLARSLSIGSPGGPTAHVDP